jgi:hypothetical protein
MDLMGMMVLKETQNKIEETKRLILFSLMIAQMVYLK